MHSASVHGGQFGDTPPRPGVDDIDAAITAGTEDKTTVQAIDTGEARHVLGVARLVPVCHQLVS